MTATLVSAEAVARAALASLPISDPLELGEPLSVPIDFDGVAVTARFTGSNSGDLLITVERALAEALQNSPLGALDVAAALGPALAAAASATGTAVAGPGTVLEPQPALAALLAKPGATVIPLLHQGTVRAMVGVAITPQQAEAAFATPHYPSPDELRAAAPGRSAPSMLRGLELLRDVSMDVTAQIGTTRMTISELLELSEGAVVELDRAAGAPADLLVNGHLIARGEVVVIDENFALRITEIVSDETAPLPS
ncbi:MAG TPA: flagellar motor switch protein FliN [Jatrophihabitans sp.]|nr:flagellar motor switch protein FliN [Jatrophihabitans sp.]